MRISDIKIMRGDMADIFVDPAEPYGEEPKDEEVMTIGVTADEKELLILYLDEKRKVCNQTLNHMNPKPKAREETLRRVRLIHGLLDKLRGTNLKRNNSSV